MHAPLLSPLQKRLLDGWQRDFPLVERPFAAIGSQVGFDEEAVIAASEDLVVRGVVSRLGPVVRPNTAGASTLAALACAPHEIDAMAAIVSAEPGVNHNYEREHPDLPIWFVATGADRDAVDATLDRLRAATGCEILDLPLLREYRIDLGFALDGSSRPHHHRPASRAANEVEKRLLGRLVDGLPRTPCPFAAVADELGLGEAEVRATIDGAIAAGVVKRFGYVVRHRPLGWSSNAMVVFAVDEAEIDAVAERFLDADQVTLLYRRRSAGPRWPWTLYAMVHGRDRAVVEAQVRDVAARWPKPLDHRILFSTRCFKQTGARLCA
ncbi:MAG: Lrp/AsnC family transcriptional regulator [Hyphomicrobiales bacterium]|nr:Lrp/AsnC family transcriptional regulator [Hyphomicrobiales bacterium]